MNEINFLKTNNSKFLFNTINEGDGLELLRNLPDNSVQLVIFDPQYRNIDEVAPINSKRIKIQKDKIINTFWRLFPEKELVQQLIMAHFEFKRIEKQEQPSRQYRNKFNKLYYQLEVKIDEKTMNEIDIILKDCEKLIDEELELEAKLNEKQFLIESHKQITSQITDNQEAQRIIYSEEEKQEQQIVQYKRIRSNSLVTEIEKARLEGKVEVYKELTLLPKTITTNQGVIIQGNDNECGNYSVRDNTVPF